MSQAAKHLPRRPAGLVLGERPLGESIGKQIERVPRSPFSREHQESGLHQPERGGSIGDGSSGGGSIGSGSIGGNKMWAVVEFVGFGDGHHREKLIASYVKEAAVADGLDLPGASEGLRGLAVANRQPDESSVGSPSDFLLEVPRCWEAGREPQPKALQALESYPPPAVPPNEEPSPLPRERGLRCAISNGASEFGEISLEHSVRKERVLVLALLASPLRQVKRMSTDPH